MDPIFFIFVLMATLIITANLLAIYWFGGMLIPIFHGGAPYITSTQEKAITMISMAKISPTDHVVDMGSGDGILLIEAIKVGAKSATGYELHPGLIKRSIRKINKLGFSKKIEILKESFWDADLKNTDVVLLYQTSPAMNKLKLKLKNELKPGSRIVSNAFNFPNWKPVQEKSGIYLYIV